MAVHADGLLAAVDEPTGRLSTGLQPCPGIPAHERRGGQPLRLRPGARPPLPLAEALGRPALLRPCGSPAEDPRGGPAGGAVRGLAPGRAWLGGVRAAALLARL